jgi:hypothetical protein
VFPAPAGPAPTGPYEYLAVPFQEGLVNNQIPAMKAFYFFIESAFGQNGAFGDRLDLINRTRVYRVEIQYLWRFPSDINGPYLTVPGKTFRFQVSDPSIGIKAINEWMPASL